MKAMFQLIAGCKSAINDIPYVYQIIAGLINPCFVSLSKSI